MASLRELYTYYCQRYDCRPNSAFCAYLDEEYERNGCQRILRTVDVSNNYLGRKGILPVLDLVKNTKTVERLDVSNNRLEHEELEHLVYCLLLHPTVNTVVLRNNCLHDGSTDHVVKLLENNASITAIDLDGNEFLPASLALVEECLAKNVVAKAKLLAEEKDLAAYRAYMLERLASFTARVEGSLTEDTSGGHLHFTTWWRNPQYRICVPRRSRVSLVLKVAQEEATRGTKQAGFAVLRYDGVRRVIELGPRTVVAESPVTPDGHCCVEVSLSPKDHCVVVPYSFQPGRTMDFTLTAKLLPDDTAALQEEGWVTLDLLDEQHDWYTTTLHGAWTAEAGGGSASLPSWRENPMFRVQYSGRQQQPYFRAAPAKVHLLLYKAVDPDNNDEKEIGLDVVEHDSNSPGHPPLICSPDLVRCSHPHQRRAAVSVAFAAASSSLDCFVVPSTKHAHQAGEYTLVIFSTVPFNVTESQFPHGWRHRAVEGEWNEEHCGGCRDLYASWKNNRAYKVLFQPHDAAAAADEDDDENDEDGGSSNKGKDSAGSSRSDACVGKRGASRAMVACLEVVAAEQQQAQQPVQPEEELDEDPEEVRVRCEVAEFKARHVEERVKTCLAAVNDVPPSYPIRRSSAFSDGEAHLLLPDTAGSFLIVPMAQHAGQRARYRLHLYSVAPFLVNANTDTLVEREREWQLAMYTSENEARHSQAADVAEAAGETRPPELREIEERRQEITRQCDASGFAFSDRDFPRGTSSLWLDPEAKPPFGFPQEYTWQRVPEICQAGCLGAEASEGPPLVEVPISPPFPYGKREWFASVVNALAAKPHWLARIFVMYDRERGFAQFRFFKTGKWVGVTVDDYLPVDMAGQLCMGYSTSPRDFFFPLAEKAFAKLHRCYEALEPKVTPELSLVSILSQALEDTSGGLCTVYHLHPQAANTVELEEEEKNVLWRKMKESSKASALHALLLRSDSPGASERRYVGLLPDHLYGLVDARFVEQQRLVKLRNWCHGVDTVWKGKWAADSPAWTETLRLALEYTETTPASPQEPQEVFWASFDEVLYYFSDLLVTEVHASRSIAEGDFAGASSKTYADDTNVRLRAPQFALEVKDVAEGCPAVEVTVGLHRADARMSVTRDRHAVATYRHALGMAVLATHDNRRHVKDIEDSQLWRLQVPVRARDILFKVLLRPHCLGQQQLTLMPFREHEKDADTPYLVSASCDQASVRLERVHDNIAVRVTGEWEGTTAGGPPSAPTWRDNPQFLLYPSETMEVSIALSRSSATDTDDGRTSVGFTVHATRLCCSYLHFEHASVVLHATGGRTPGHSAHGTITLAGMPERRGMPYMVVPYCSEPGVGGAFSLTVIGNQPMRLAPVEPRLDWHRMHHSVSMSAEDGSAGGSPSYPSWRCSPQLLLEFPIARAGRVLVAAVNRATEDRRTAIGLMLLRGNSDPHFGGKRRRLFYEAADVVAMSEENVGRVEFEVDVGAVENKPGSGCVAPLVLAVFTSAPYKEAVVDVAFYSEAELEVSPVKEWSHTALEEGSWELGQTAGGNRRQFASWINNPFVGLTTVRPTSVVALLIQYPRASEQPIVKRLGKKKALLPPPITNPDRRMTIELDLVQHDADLTAIDSTGPTRSAETSLAARLPASDDNQPYILVPVTTVIDQDADYKLFVYADQPIDVFPLEKQRLWYV